VGLAAAIGREFTTETLLQASGCDDAALVRSLDELWRWRIVREQGASAYDFSHDLIREVAYRALSPALRRHHHLHVARALETLHEDAPAVVSGQIAAHYDRAGALEPATAWYQQAADSALDIYANLEAIRLLERAISLLRSLPRTDDRARREITLLTALQAPLGLAEGFSSPRLAAAQQRALALAAGSPTALPSPVLRSLAIASLARGNFTAAREFGERLRARGELNTDNVSLVESAYILGIAAFWQGRLTAAHQHFEEAIARYQPEASSAHIQHYGLDPRAICLSRLANTRWFLGFPAEAEAARDEALALAQATGHPATLATVWVFAACLALDMEDIPLLRQFTALLAPSRREREGRPTELTATAFASYLAVLDGRPDGRLDEIERILDEPGQADHAPGMRASIARILVAARTAAGDPQRGLVTTERALNMGEVRLWEPEIRRVRAEFLAALRAPAADVAAEFARAQDAARAQAAVSLSRRISASQRTLHDHAHVRSTASQHSRLPARNGSEERLRNAP
jgi:tetratricopeptide (TPR) repeat protein